MLGWAFSVKDKEIGRIAYWTGGLWSDTWLHSLAAEDKAYLMKDNGGYPNVWHVKTEDFLKYHADLVSTQIVKFEWVEVEVWDQS